MPTPPESRESVWIVPASPAIWATHFLATYATASVWCSKWAGPAGTLDAAGVAIAVYTAIALTAIVALGLRGWRAHRSGHPSLDADTPEDRHRFLGLATLLLSGLGALGVVYSAMAVWIGGTCV